VSGVMNLKAWDIAILLLDQGFYVSESGTISCSNLGVFIAFATRILEKENPI